MRTDPHPYPPHPHHPPQPFSAVRRALLAEWQRVAGPPLADLRGRWFAVVPLATGSTLLVLLFHLASWSGSGAHLAWLLGGTRADIPLRLALARAPMSLFVPAPDLPVWGAMAQVFTVFALAERTLGPLRTVVIALVVTLTATMAVRVAIHLGPGHPLGLPSSDAHVLDTGSSAAVVGLLICVGWMRRAPVLFTGTILAMVIEAAITSNLAGRGHLVSVAVAIVCAVSGCPRQERDTRDAVEGAVAEDALPSTTAGLRG